ncbi:MAG: hypothetical protein DME55_14170 [Verrucomicrobia bacterium]|nr:MAG: hypothetical protein DME55_14170 [Verrucomicrobiota bacterium]
MRILIVGAGGRLGAALVREFDGKFQVTGLNRTQLDLSDLGAVREKLGNSGFDVLINAAGFTKVDLCETQPDRAFLINAEAPRVLAEICGEKSFRLIHFSSRRKKCAGCARPESRSPRLLGFWTGSSEFYRCND